MDWPASLTARPQLIAEAHAFELRDAWLAAERQASVDRRQVTGGRFAVQDGVAVIPVSGALINRYDFLADGSPYSSYSAITREVNRAASDTSIRAIVLAVNSPGGNADGILAPAAAIRAARKIKPVTAIVGSIAASGGYWLAAQAGEIVLSDDLAQVGSIGVYTMHIAISAMLEKAGIDVSVISSGAHKVDGHPFAALPPAVRDQIQGEVDDLRIMFAREVSAGRPALSEAAALKTEARMFGALNPKTGRRPAIDARLADRVASLPAVIAGFAAAKPSRISIEGSKPMDETQIRASERTRIKEITSSSHAAGREAQASYLALETSMTASEAVGLLAASPKSAAGTSAAQTYEQRSAAAGGDGDSYVDVTAGPGTQAGSQAKAKAGWSKAIAEVNKSIGAAKPGAAA